MINITDDFTYIILVGDVFLKDAVRIELKKQGDYCRLTKIVGSGKKYEKIDCRLDYYEINISINLCFW